jgi:hypothetical protein
MTEFELYVDGKYVSNKVIRARMYGIFAWLLAGRCTYVALRTQNRALYCRWNVYSNKKKKIESNINLRKKKDSCSHKIVYTYVFRLKSITSFYYFVRWRKKASCVEGGEERKRVNFFSILWVSFIYREKYVLCINISVENADLWLLCAKTRQRRGKVQINATFRRVHEAPAFWD